MNGMVRDKRISSENMTKIAIFMDGWTLSHVLYDPKLCRIRDKPEPCQIHTSREEVAPYSPQGHFDLTEENCALPPSVVVSLITTVIANFRVNFSLLQARAVCEWGFAPARV